jgi:hypothetical protein
LQLPDRRELARLACHDADPLVSETAAWLLPPVQPALTPAPAGALLISSEPKGSQAFSTAVQGNGATANFHLRGVTMLTTIEKVLLLRGVDLFQQLAGRDLANVAQLAQEVRFAAGERLLTQNEPGDFLLILVSGEADIVLNDANTLATRGPRSVIGEMALLSRRPRMASCIANTDVTALKLEHSDFQDLMFERPEMTHGIIHVLIDRLEEAGQKTTVSPSHQSTERKN